MEIDKNKLKVNKKGDVYTTGYRMVYFYRDKYSIAEYSKTIEGFMIGLASTDPIMDESDTPAFVSIDDLLEKSLNGVINAVEVGLYDVNGQLIGKKEK